MKPHIGPKKRTASVTIPMGTRPRKGLALMARGHDVEHFLEPPIVERWRWSISYGSASTRHMKYRVRDLNKRRRADTEY